MEKKEPSHNVGFWNKTPEWTIAGEFLLKAELEHTDNVTKESTVPLR